MADKQEHPDAFVDFGVFEAVKVQARIQTGNVVKENQVVSGGACAIELHSNEDDHPSIVIHREEDKVDRVEFICICGRGTTLKFEYDGE